MLPVVLSANGPSGYSIANSLRFRSSASAYLNRTPASAGNRQTWTFSVWMKRGALVASNYANFFTANDFSTGGNGDSIDFSNDRLDFYLNGANNGRITSAAVLRDPSAWYHIVVVLDTTQATASNRMRMYVNGTQITSFFTASYPAQNYQCPYLNTAIQQDLGRGYQYFDGYLTEVNFIDGQALTPSSFGEIDSTTGVWKAKRYTGTYGTNGFRLNFSNGTSTTTLGYDSSGNGNNWTPTNISLTTGSTYDSMIDSPTSYASGVNNVGNYAVLNPLDAYSGTLSNGNLYWTGSYGSQNGHGVRSTLKVRPVGKWYVEAYNTTISGSGNSCMLGFTSSTQTIASTAFGQNLTPWLGVNASVFNNNVRFYSAGVSGSLADATVLFASYASGDLISIAIDFDSGKIWIGKNGTWYNSGNPATGVNATSTFTSGSLDWAFWAEYVAASDDTNRSGAVCNFGQRPFAYTPPSGYKSLCTQNLPGVTIQNGAQYMAASLYTGTGSSVSISNAVNGVGFQPDFVWIKDRSAAASHNLFDVIRGPRDHLSSNLTDAEYTEAAGYSLTAFNTNGFALGTDNAGSGRVNFSGDTFVGWQWKAGGTAVTNTAGSITSSVSANTTAGFSVVTWTCNNTANQSIGHGLGVAPSLVIVKDRDQGTGFNWNVWFTGFTANEYLQLNTTIAKASYSTLWYTVPDSTKIYIGTAGTAVNNATDKMVAYCFAAIPGYSAFGSYTGNGSADGPFVYCGFRPAFVLIKGSSFVSNWFIEDQARNGYNVNDGVALRPNLSSAEDGTTTYNLDLLSNGFKLRSSAGDSNTNGATFIWAAFASNPFQNALAR